MNLFYLLIIPSSICGFYLIYKVLEKLNFKLSGLEISIFQLSFILIFFGFEYESYVLSRDLGSIFIIIGILFLIYLAYYYILRMIKTKQYIRWQLFIIYIILFFINGYTLSYIPMEGWDALGYAFLFFILCLGLFVYLLLINLTTLIIRKIKNIHFKDFSLILKKDLLIILIIFAAFIPIVYGNNYERKREHENRKQEEIAKEKTIDYLNKKYGSGNFEIINSSSYYNNEYLFEVSTDYLDETFEIIYDENNIENDEFLLKYYSYVYGINVSSFYDLEEYIKKYIRSKLLNEYNIDVKFSYINIDEKLLEKNFNDIKELDNLIEYAEVEIEEIIIYKVFNKNESEEFCNFIINLYEKLDYKKDILWFKFNYDNPFSSSLHYKDDGYLRNAGNWYLVYTDATPIHIKK